MKSQYIFKKKTWFYLARCLDALGYLFRKPKQSERLSAKKILVVRLDQMGDIIQTLPFIESLKSSFPDAEIHALTTSVGEELLSHQNLASTFVWDSPWFDAGRKTSIRKSKVYEWIRSHQFDCAFELRGDIRLIWLLRRSGVKSLVGYGVTGGGFLLDVEAPWKRTDHAINKNLTLLEAIGGKIAQTVPVLRAFQELKEHERGKNPRLRLAVHPDAGTPAKRWPITRFKDLMKTLAQQRPVEFILIGQNAAMGEELEKNFTGPTKNMMGRTTIKELIGVLAQCDGLITNDSGPAHVMAALEKPVFILWSGTADPSLWAPRGKNIFILSHSVPCSPCSLAQCPVPGHPCLDEISAEQVSSVITRSVTSSGRFVLKESS